MKYLIIVSLFSFALFAKTTNTTLVCKDRNHKVVQSKKVDFSRFAKTELSFIDIIEDRYFIEVELDHTTLEMQYFVRDANNFFIYEQGVVDFTGNNTASFVLGYSCSLLKNSSAK
ncbi:MAG: hypothetical protein N4A33_13085 [Bacteriovoracaceae bacterium]|jgi:hypothetical protein|nr:hypothetical protein [Bacteriovoracaceae bacterium]